MQLDGLADDALATEHRRVGMHARTIEVEVIGQQWDLPPCALAIPEDKAHARLVRGHRVRQSAVAGFLQALDFVSGSRAGVPYDTLVWGAALLCQ